MNLSSHTAVPAVSPINSMPNVIDSLKRLERIGSEESETVRKILEASRDLSLVICRALPDSMLEANICGFVDSEGTIQIGLPIPKAKHIFGVYRMIDSYDGKHLRRGESNVEANRDNALAFSKDVSLGVLELFNLVIEKAHEESEGGYSALSSALIDASIATDL